MTSPEGLGRPPPKSIIIPFCRLRNINLHAAIDKLALSRIIMEKKQQFIDLFSTKSEKLSLITRFPQGNINKTDVRWEFQILQNDRSKSG
jgi:hypothetical protein